MVASTHGAPTAERGGRAKRYYTVTKAGRQVLAEAQHGFQQLLESLSLLEQSLKNEYSQ